MVWEDVNETYYDKIKTRRTIKGYGTKQSKEMVK
jgi:hypothetical protein